METIYTECKYIVHKVNNSDDISLKITCNIYTEKLNYIKSLVILHHIFVGAALWCCRSTEAHK